MLKNVFVRVNGKKMNDMYINEIIASNKTDNTFVIVHVCVYRYTYLIV